ncbi:DNA fragmentation factor subunit beta [Gadus morhua]|uniref:DNA fragmentation factor, beta polypeptide (caspase-activated DNase) n=1 Tax=Gadus morhua TaxID=8049 RepID=A0A8C4ZHL8_GADMO|nr:DNA fragmentation factor subunit beta [Gadus morhua]
MCALESTKSVKLRSFGETNKYGVAAKDLKELLKKGCKLLKKPMNCARVCTYDDGTELTEEYFKTLPRNVELVLLSGDEAWNGFMDEIAGLLSKDRTSSQLLEAARHFRSDDRSAKRRKLLADSLVGLEDHSEMETREDDQEWFEGLLPRFKTKSAYMKSNCERRIRGYMTELEVAKISSQSPRVKEEFAKTARGITDLLKADRYNGHYFDRSEVEEKNRLCTAQGWFTCQGAFDQDLCKSLHSINPYGNKESRINFGTWNLDHRIEKKRTVIPALVDAVQNHQSSAINLTYFYRLLFTTDNLRLVHFVCHKKVPHLLQCDSKKMYKRATKTPKPKTPGKGKRPRIK